MSTAKSSVPEPYREPAVYEEVYLGSDPAEAPFYTAASATGKILYLGSGNGRLLKHFVGANQNIMGVDIAPEMVAAARQSFPDLRFVQGDALTMSLGEEFDVVLAPYRFICHFDKKQLPDLMRTVAAHLRKGGRFVADSRNPYRIPADPNVEGEIVSIEQRGAVVEKVYHMYHRDRQGWVEWVERIDVHSGMHSFLQLHLFYHFPAEVQAACEAAGLQLERVLGDFQRGVFSESTSPHLIVEASRE